VCYFFYNPTDSGAVQLTQSNLDTILGKTSMYLFIISWLVNSASCNLVGRGKIDNHAALKTEV
jgi:hypothetical protein